MPRQSASQETGRTGERWFISQLPANWIFQPPLDDVGVDGVVVVCEPGPLNGAEFRVQIKSSAKWIVRNDTILLAGLKRSAVLYWVTGFTPTLIVAYETSSRRGFCAWANQLLASRTDDLGEEGGSITLEMPMRTPIDPAVWDAIRLEVSGISTALGRNLVIAERALPFLRALNELSGAAKALYFAHAATPKEPQRTSEQRALIAELEITCHCDAVRAVLALDRDLQSSGIALGGLQEYAAEYVKRCSAFISNFQQLVDAGDQRRKCDFFPEGLAQERLAMIHSIISAMHELTQGAVMATSKSPAQAVVRSDPTSEPHGTESTG